MTAPAPHDPKTLAALAAMSRRGSRAARGLLHAALSDPANAAAMRGAARTDGGSPAAPDSVSAIPSVTEPTAPTATVSESAIAGWILIGGSALATLLLLFTMTRLTPVQRNDPTPSVAPAPTPTPKESPVPPSAPTAIDTTKPPVEPATPVPIPVVTPVVTAPPSAQPRESPAARAQADWRARVASSRNAAVDALSPLAKMHLLERLSALNLVAELLARGEVSAATAELQLIPEAVPPGAPPAAAVETPNDGKLEGSLRGAGQGSRARVDKLRSFLAAVNPTIGPRDAGALADEALRGVTEVARRAAQEAILARYRESAFVAVALLNELGDAHSHVGSVDFLSRWTGVEFAPGARVHDEQVRAAVLIRAVEVAATEAAELSEAARALAAVNRRRVELMTQAPFDGRSPESAQLALATGTPGVDSQSVKRRVASADGAVQRFVAAQAEVINARVRSAASDAAAQIAERAKRVRQVDSDVLAQAITNELAVLDLAAVGATGGFVGTTGTRVHPQEPRSFDHALNLFEQAEVLSDGAACGSERWQQARGLLARSAAADRQGLGRSAFLALAELEERCGGDAAPGELALAAAARAAVRMEMPEAARAPLDEAARSSFAQALAEFRLGNAARLSNRLKKREVALMVEDFGFGLPNGARRISELAAARSKRPPNLTTAEIASMLLVEQAALGVGAHGWAHDLARTLSAPLPELDPAAPWSAWLPPDYNEGQ